MTPSESAPSLPSAAAAVRLGDLAGASGFAARTGVAYVCESDGYEAPPGWTVASVEESTNHRAAWHSATAADDLLALAARGSHRTGAPLLMPGPGSGGTRSGREETRLEDKIEFRMAMDQNGVRTPPWRAVRSWPENVETLRKELGGQLVVQAARGSGGHGTLLDDCAPGSSGLTGAWPEGGQALVSRYVRGVTVNCHGAVLSGQEREVGPVSVQLGECADLRSSFGQYAGSVFTTGILDGASRSELARAVLLTGRLLRDDGFNGVFGVDAVVDEWGTVHVLEVNARLQASTWLLASGQPSGGLPWWWLRGKWPDGHDPDGLAQIVNGRSQLCVRYNGTREAEVASLGGMDRSHGGNVIGEGFSVIYSGIPRVGRHVLPGALLCRIASDNPLFDPWTNKLTGNARGALDLVRQSVVLREITHDRRCPRTSTPQPGT